MTPAHRRWAARLAASIGLLLACIAAVLGPAGPASAHAVLVSSSPVAGSVLPSAPTEVVLTFSEDVRKVPDKIRVLASDGSRVDRGEPSFSGSLVTIQVDPAGPRGTYLVSYRVISADGHPVAGGYTYSVGAPSAAPADTGNSADQVGRGITVAVGVTRYLGYAGLALLIGPVLVLSLLWPRRLSRRGPGRLIWAGAGLVGLGTLAGLWLQVPYTEGGGPFEIGWSTLGDVLGSTFGTASVVRLGVLAAAAILLRPVIDGRPGRADQVVLGILGVAGLATWPLAGHPAASPIPAVSVVVDAVHLASMAVWLGGLVMLVAFLLRWADDRELGAILPVWSRWAAAAVSALVLAGTVQALVEVGSPGALLSTTYGRVLTAKIILLAVVIAVASYSRQVVLRRVAVPVGGPAGGYVDDPAGGGIEGPAGGGGAEGPPGGGAGGPPGLRGLRRAVLVELAITAAVLVLSATLVQTTPARTAAANGTADGQAFFSQTVTSPIYSLQVEVDPATSGNNSIHLYAYTPDNKPLPVVEWRATAALPGKGVEPTDIPLLQLTDNHASGEISLPSTGAWQFSFTLRISDIDQATVTVAVPIT